MREWTKACREGTNMGLVDWTHEIAKDKPAHWRDAEMLPGAYLFQDRKSVV